MKLITDHRNAVIGKYYLNGNYRLEDCMGKFISSVDTYAICTPISTVDNEHWVSGYRLLLGYLPRLEMDVEQYPWYIGKGTPLWELTDEEVLEHVVLETI